jgi:prolyl-tRNA synthetase
LKSIQSSLLERATKFRDDHIFEPKDYEELKQTVENGWAYAWWCGDAACEAKVKEDTGLPPAASLQPTWR